MFTFCRSVQSPARCYFPDNCRAFLNTYAPVRGPGYVSVTGVVIALLLRVLLVRLLRVILLILIVVAGIAVLVRAGRRQTAAAAVVRVAVRTAAPAGNEAEGKNAE